MNAIDTKYDLSDTSIDLYEVSSKIEADCSSVDILTAFHQYEIVQQDINNTLSYDIPSGQVAIYETTLPQAKSDIVAFSLGGTKILQKKSCFLYGKDITLEYEFTESASELMYDSYGYDSIDDLTGNLGPYISWAQIYGVVKIDGVGVAHGKSDILGSKETLQIDITTAGNTTSLEKEMTFGALYSIVFDYQFISPYEIADGYNSLPQTVSEQNKLNESNIYGSKTMMNTLTLLGKTYFSQVDTNNAMLANFSDMRYERGLSVAVVDFTPHIYNQNGSSPRLYKEGTIGIDVLGNWTIFNSLKDDGKEEAQIKHSAGYLSSFYESETIKQFTGMQTVSTAEVLDKAQEQGVDILYLSKANMNELEASSLSTKNKTDIAKLIDEGNYITVPRSEITIGSWTGTGYIVYEPNTGTSTYIINNNLNGGSLCSWVGLAFFCDIVASVVECTWAFDIIMLGASVLGTGLILLTGGLALAPLLIATAGFGMIVGGAFYIKSVGDRLYESTELMDLYIDGNEEAGELLKLKSGFHVMGVGIATVGMDLISKGVSTAFAKTQLGNKVGGYFAKAFGGTKYGVDGALDILNSISPKYANILTNFIKSYEKNAAEYIVATDDHGGITEVENVLDEINNNNIGKNIPSNELVFGSDTKSATKLANQMNQRGWTPETLKATVDNPFTKRLSVNKRTGNTATVFYNKNGAYVIVDDLTKEIVQVSDNINPSSWIPDSQIIDPYIPKE